VKGNAWFIFSTTGGEKPISGYSKMKLAIDKAIADLRKQEGRDPMPPWRLHDLRRTARTRMSRAGVEPDHAERCLGHIIGGVRGVYDRHEFAEEKRAAFTKLGELVERIVSPVGDGA
jgi:integrase